MKTNKNQNDWKLKNMTTISARYKNKFVESFKQSCKELNVSQADIIRSAMEETIMNANTQLINELLLNPTKENVSYFLNSRDGEVFSIRDFETTRMDIAKSRYEYKHCELSDDLKGLLSDIINNPMQDNLHCNENDTWTCLDADGENGYSIAENDLWYNLAEWVNGENAKNVYIFK